MSNNMRSVPATVLAILAVASWAAPAAASAQGGSVLSLLDTGSRRLAMGEFQGALSSSDYLSARDNYLEAWALEGRAGQTVTIDLMSDDFDSYLFVVGPGLAETLADDDGGGGCHARITVTFLEDGMFRVVASSVETRTTGTYTLRVTDTPGPTPSHSCGEPNPEVIGSLATDGRSLAVGETATGQLTMTSPEVQPGRRGEAWALPGRAGHSVTITQETTDFDSYLYVSGPGLAGVLTDDDSGGDLNAQITVTFPADGEYLVVASALADDATGSYTLRLGEPVDPAALSTDGRSVAVGQSAQGMLSTDDPIVLDGRRGQAWALEGEAGQQITVELRSEEFDCFLYVAGPGLTEILSDDDSAGDLDSRITATLPESGSYRIIVSAVGSVLGSFTLQVR